MKTERALTDVERSCFVGNNKTRSGFKESSLPDDVWIAVWGVVSEPLAIEQITRFREDFTDPERKSVINFSDYSFGLSKLEQVFTAFEPIARRLVRKRCSLFWGINLQERAEIESEQMLRFWEILSLNFRWQEYVGERTIAAAPSLLKYLSVSTGSFFAERIICDGDVVAWGVPKRGRKKGRGFFEDSLAEAIIKEEDRKVLDSALKEWEQIESAINIRAAILKALGNLTVEEIAKREQAACSAIQMRINKGKLSLAKVLKENGISIVNEVSLTKDVRWCFETRTELLEQRREQLMAKFPAWRNFFPAKAARAVEVFYGLNGQPPVFDYPETARITGMSVASVGVSTSLVLRQIFGIEKVSVHVIQREEEKSLFKSWQLAREQIGLLPEEERVIVMYYEEGLSFGEIAKIMGFSKESARRRKKRAMQRIRVSLNSVADRPFPQED